MNKLNKLLAGIAAVAMLSACSNDEPEVNGGTLPDGDKAYLKVNIQSANSRSTVIGGYEYGTQNEHKVDNAHFFFFDDNGKYVGRTNPSAPTGTDKDHVDGTPDGNIEWIGENVIVLDDLTDNKLPNFMLSVLNCPESFKPVAGQSYSEVTSTLAQFGELGKFVMTTSSYYGTDAAHDNRYPMLTKLVTDNFALSRQEVANAEVVNVYVERLAAKVSVSLEEGLTPVEGTDLYEIDATVAGAAGDNPGTNADTKLYVRLEGWTLNATAKNSYLSKQLKESWKETAPFANWDKPTDFRSFWAMSWPYDKASVASKNNKDYFSYTDYNKATKNNYAAGNCFYCNENTNVAANLLKGGAVVPAYTTHVALAATVCDKDGNGLNLVEYQGLLFTKENYINYVLGLMAAKGKVYYTREQTGTEKVQAKDEHGNLVYEEDGTTPVMADQPVYTYTQMPASAFDWTAADKGTGTIYVLATAKTGYDDLYKNDENGEKVAVNVEGKTDLEVMNEGLVAEQNPETFGKATAFNGGAMFYTIPIEHYAQSGSNALDVTDEGYYGVVRNHWYRLSINKILRVGHGVYNPGSDTEPGEPLIPDDPETPLFYVDAQINILSWKIINQGGIELK